VLDLFASREQSIIRTVPIEDEMSIVHTEFVSFTEKISVENLTPEYKDTRNIDRCFCVLF
jgi:hypothetical protein